MRPYTLLTVLLIAAPVFGDEARVEIREFRFIPDTITVSVGDSVRWVNREKRQYHSIRFEQNGEPESPYLFPEESFTQRFDRPGRFAYRCGPHPEMTGVVEVTE